MDGDAKLKPKQRAMLAALVETGGHVEAAARAAKIGKVTHYAWIKESEEYATAVEEAKELAGDVLEDEARRRALQGVGKLKFHNGKPIMVPLMVGDEQKKDEDGNPIMVPYVEHEYSDTLLIVLLKMAGRFIDSSKVQHTGAGGGPIEIAEVVVTSRAEASRLLSLEPAAN